MNDAVVQELRQQLHSIETITIDYRQDNRRDNKQKEKESVSTGPEPVSPSMGQEQRGMKTKKGGEREGEKERKKKEDEKR